LTNWKFEVTMEKRTKRNGFAAGGRKTDRALPVIARRSARARRACREATHRAGHLSADAQRAGRRLQSEDEPRPHPRVDGKRCPSRARCAEGAFADRRIERLARAALCAQRRARSG